ncbi:tyrosine-type recombinase/integrase [Lysinibacillus fusiformis]|uniref:tyrosine-type recombinase/integrase n=1 Tax=Lysinibacillus fusiformis TaxID=28031 RepID=UPI0035C112FF
MDRVTAHCLRHSFATHLIARGVEKDYVHNLLVHKEYRTTEKYYVYMHEEMFEQHSKKLVNFYVSDERTYLSLNRFSYFLEILIKRNLNLN